MYLSAILLSQLCCKGGVNGRHTTWHRASWANELTMAFRRHLSIAFAAGVIGTLGADAARARRRTLETVRRASA
jgi:hypothetical protein